MDNFKGLVDNAEKITLRFVLLLLAFTLGVSGITGNDVTIKARTEVEGYILLVCVGVLVFIPIFNWAWGKIRGELR